MPIYKYSLISVRKEANKYQIETGGKINNQPNLYINSKK